MQTYHRLFLVIEWYLYIGEWYFVYSDHVDWYVMRYIFVILGNTQVTEHANLRFALVYIIFNEPYLSDAVWTFFKWHLRHLSLWCVFHFFFFYLIILRFGLHSADHSLLKIFGSNRDPSLIDITSLACQSLYCVSWNDIWKSNWYFSKI